MLKRKRLALILVVLALALAGVGAFVLWPRTHRITLEEFDQIEKGMSRAEVEAILGPPSDYSTGPFYGDPQYHERGPDFRSGQGPGMAVELWADDTGRISILFGPEGVSRKHIMHVIRIEQSTFENLQWRFGRQWRRWFQ